MFSPSLSQLAFSVPRYQPSFLGLGRLFVLTALTTFGVGFAAGALGVSVLLEPSPGSRPHDASAPRLALQRSAVDNLPRATLAAVPPMLDLRGFLHRPEPATLMRSEPAVLSRTEPEPVPAEPLPSAAQVRSEPTEPLPGAPQAVAEPDAVPSSLAQGEALVALATPDGPSAAAENVPTTEHVEVRRGDTLMALLTGAGLERSEAHAAIDSLRAVYDPRRLQAGQKVALEWQPQTDTRQFTALSINVDFESDVQVVRAGDGRFTATTVAREFTREHHYGDGTIDGSLYLSALDAGVPEATIVDMIRVYSWDIDWQRDVQAGDRFAVLYERRIAGDQVRSGDMLFAELHLRDREVAVYRFERDDGTVDYVDRSGRSLRKFLLRTPVDGARLSSRFGPRKHPVLGYTRMHKGADFAAPTGTPIYAAGNGEIVQIGRNGGYGNYIRIRHNGRFQTAYAHMHKFAKGLKKGARVKQGQVIGYVGSTGRSTGPHLHYEVLVDGAQVNPLEVKQASAGELKGLERARFEKEMARIDALRRASAATYVAQRQE